ncbi:uncharacterized protein LOC121424087 [Lytechinus variegatus]|uniref:uncharacterized protein LOC121424087 n=1 Tax=Lytechinus variegatus TaxID=7654 RepID=UPI001BB26BBB|nr:uncharacterized protein LOC121424087 [Lytechinus variegatus]
MADSGDPTNRSSTPSGQMSRPGSLRTVGEVPPNNPMNPPLSVDRSPFTDLECHELAGLLHPDDFRCLGLMLGYHEAAISRYKMQNRDGSYEGTYKMLTDWKKRVLDHDQRENLSNGLDKAGVVSLALQVRHGRKLEYVTTPPHFAAQASVPASSSQAIDPPRSLQSTRPILHHGPFPNRTPLPRNTLPCPGSDIDDIGLYNLSRHLRNESYHKLGLALKYSLDQLDAFKYQASNNIPEAGLSMLRDLKSQVGHIRREDFRNLLKESAPTLVEFVENY